MFAIQGNYRYIDKLQKLIDDYNKSFHRSIQMKPIEVSKDNEREVFQNLFSDKKKFARKTKFKIGDVVRVSKVKGVFEKGKHELIKTFQYK